MAAAYFQGSDHAAIYAKFRPLPPQELIDDIICYLKKKKGFVSPKLALDVGCGSGQSTCFLAPYFENVLGIDASKAQLEEAIKKTVEINVSYKVSLAENLPVPDESAQLVTASTACHWFDLPLFFEEAKRIISPNGVLALFSNLLPSLLWGDKTKELTDSFFKLYSEETKEFWGPQTQMILNKYTDQVFVDMPFVDIYRREDFYIEKSASVTEIVGFVQSWSGFQRYKESKGSVLAQGIIDRFAIMLLETMGETNPDEAKLVLHFPFFLLMGRKPPN